MIIIASPPNEKIIFEALILPQQWEERYGFWYRQWEMWYRWEAPEMLDVPITWGEVVLEAKQIQLLRKAANKLVHEVTV